MVGAAVNVIPFMIQRQVPGIGPNVLPAYLLGAVPAVLAGLAYAMLASAMPRAGGSYVYASRALSPYLGFVASFSQWFSLSVVMGVVSFLITPFLRDIAVALQWQRRGGDARAPDDAAGHRAGGAVGGHRAQPARREGLRAADGAADVPDLRAGVGGDRRRLQLRPRRLRAVARRPRRAWPRCCASAGRGRRSDCRVARCCLASVLLFASFIGFDSIAQAGGEARRPGRDLPLAIFIAVGVGRPRSTSCSPPRSTTPRRGPTSPPRRSAAT